LGKRLVIVAVAVAALLAGAIVVIGTAADSGSSATGGASAADASLPSGHPSIGDDATATPVATGATVAKTVRRLEKARAADPSDSGVLLDLGDAYFLQQEYDRAGEAYGAALRLRPSDPTATVRLAMVWHASGESQRAVKAIEGVLAERPDDQEAHYSLAIVYFSEGRVAEARDQWATAARLDPSSELGRRSKSFVDLLKDAQSSEPQPAGD
jgi:cytochrome c-type biogenesis protein CcmH/NrfG